MDALRPPFLQAARRAAAAAVLVLAAAVPSPGAAAADAPLWRLERPLVPFDESSPPVRLDYRPLARAERNWRLCVLYPHLKDAYWLSVNFGMVEEARRLGVSFTLYEAGGYPNLERQREQLAACAASGADAIILGTVSYSGLSDEVERIAGAMPVIAAVNDIDDRGITAKAAVSWVEMGAVAGRFLAERHPGGSPPVRAAWFPGPAAAGWVRFVEQGFRSAIAGSAVEVVATFHGDTGREQQVLLVEEALERYPGIDYIVGSGPTAEVAVSILRMRGLEGRVGIVSTYMSHAVYRGIRRGRILAAPTDFAVLQGRLAIELAVRALEGRLAEPHVGPAIVPVTPANVEAVGAAESLAPASFRAVFQFDGRADAAGGAADGGADGAPERGGALSSRRSGGGRASRPPPQAALRGRRCSRCAGSAPDRGCCCGS
jgi:protein TorT